MVTAAAMVVDQHVGITRVARELNIPYTTLAEWVRKYWAGGRAGLESGPGRGGKRSGAAPQGGARASATREPAPHPVGQRAA
ncbi:MAG: helix-turn-helix domain-containing protein, partial [Burkholderiales bacterium]